MSRAVGGLVVESGAVAGVAAGDYRWLFDGVTGGDGPGEANVLRVGPGQGCGGEGSGPGGKAWLPGGREGVPDLLGQQVAVVSHSGHRGKAGLRGQPGGQVVLATFAGEYGPDPADGGLAAPSAVQRRGQGSGREANVPRAAVGLLAVPVPVVAVPELAAGGLHAELRIHHLDRVDDGRVGGGLDTEPDEFQEAGVDDRALADAVRPAVTDVVGGAGVGVTVLGQPQVVRAG